MKQALEAFEWNYNTDLDNIPACEQWAKMLKANITALRAAIEQANPLPPPPECQTEAEKIAYAFGWYKALEVNYFKKLKTQTTQQPIAWYIKRVAPGMRDDGRKLGPWFKKSDAEEWVDDNHILCPLVDMKELNNE